MIETSDFNDQLAVRIGLDDARQLFNTDIDLILPVKIGILPSDHFMKISNSQVLPIDNYRVRYYFCLMITPSLGCSLMTPCVCDLLHLYCWSDELSWALNRILSTDTGHKAPYLNANLTVFGCHSHQITVLKERPLGPSLIVISCFTRRISKARHRYGGFSQYTNASKPPRGL